jgi:curved DNA-binding protein CbpA
MSEQDPLERAGVGRTDEKRPLTYYDILELDRDATEEEIKASYYQLARQYHPDVAPDDPKLAETFSLINRAYRVLSDARRRYQYDRTLPQKSYPLRNPTPEKIWREATDVVLIRADRFGPLNQAMQATIPITLDEDLLVLAIPGSERHLAGHMDTAANRNSIINALELVSGSKLEFRIIDGSSAEEWEQIKQAEAKARESADRSRRQQAPAGTGAAARSGEGPWNEVTQRIHRQYQQLAKRQYPQSKARYLREALAWIAGADEELRYQSDADEDAHERSLARAIERLASVLDLSPVLVAMQYENMKRAGDI